MCERKDYVRREMQSVDLGKIVPTVLNNFGNKNMRGGHNTKGKTEADSLKKISIAILKKYGYFLGRTPGQITWTPGLAQIKSSVGVAVSIPNYYGGTLHIYYTLTDNITGEQKRFDYEIPISTSPCRYGGKRYWLTCPWYKNGKYCGRRISILYLLNDYFACRHCHNLTYASRNALPYDVGFVSIPDLEEQREKIKRTSYAGKPTKQYQKLLRMEERFMTGINLLARALGVGPKT